jgi:hypothetical protein
MDTGHSQGLGPDELRWAATGPERVGPTGSSQKDRIELFSNLFLMRKQFQKNLVIFLKHQKYTENPKISEKFLETHRDTNNSNKIFGAHEKDLRAF